MMPQLYYLRLFKHCKLFPHHVNYLYFYPNIFHKFDTCLSFNPKETTGA